MSAINGSTRSGRSPARLVTCAVAVLFALSAVFAAGASAKPPPVTHTYLALGDSLAFGYSQQLYNENLPAGDPATAFENGYVNDYAKRLTAAKTWQTQDLGCPGETTGSLIGDGAAAAALEASQFKAKGAPPCAYQEAWEATHEPGHGGPLHIPYAGESQLEKAAELIAVDSAAGKPVELITLNIGANDQLAVVHGCEAEVGKEFETEGQSKYGLTPSEAVKRCLESHVPALIESIIKNTEAAAYALRSGALNGLPYTGTIIYQAGYDPYGVLFNAGEYGFGTGKELLEGSRPLAGLIDAQETSAYLKPATEGGFATCVANPFEKFNPGTRREATRLQAWTNMANTTESNGFKNGPDIHPTPLGYLVLAKIMKSQCG